MKPCFVQKGCGVDSSSITDLAESADVESMACAANVPTIISTSYINNVRTSSCTSNLINKSQWSQLKVQTEVCCLRIAHANATYLNKVVSQVQMLLQGALRQVKAGHVHANLHQGCQLMHKLTALPYPKLPCLYCPNGTTHRTGCCSHLHQASMKFGRRTAHCALLLQKVSFQKVNGVSQALHTSK